MGKRNNNPGLDITPEEQLKMMEDLQNYTSKYTTDPDKEIIESRPKRTEPVISEDDNTTTPVGKSILDYVNRDKKNGKKKNRKRNRKQREFDESISFLEGSSDEESAFEERDVESELDSAVLSSIPPELFENNEENPEEDEPISQDAEKYADMLSHTLFHSEPAKNTAKDIDEGEPDKPRNDTPDIIHLISFNLFKDTLILKDYDGNIISEYKVYCPPEEILTYLTMCLKTAFDTTPPEYKQPDIPDLEPDNYSMESILAATGMDKVLDSIPDEKVEKESEPEPEETVRAEVVKERSERLSYHLQIPDDVKKSLEEAVPSSGAVEKPTRATGKEHLKYVVDQVVPRKK